MVLSDEQKRACAKRLLMSRMRILLNHGFYGLLLMHMQFTLDETCETAATDGQRIMFGPAFMDDLSDPELDFILMHEIMHNVLAHCTRTGDRDNELFNIACDIVVNSNILRSHGMDKKSITLHKYGESMHLTPDGREGWEYTAEQVYEMLLEKGGNGRGGGSQGSGGQNGNAQGNGGSGSRNAHGRRTSGISGQGGQGGQSGSFRDDHTRWGTAKTDQTMLRDEWRKRLVDACEAISVRDPSNTRGMLPAFAERFWKALKKPQTDWRTVLQDFVQEEITDYSFAPPDRRMGDSPFFLPDFSEKDDFAADILFMIDTSGSMSDDMITAAYSEIKGAIDQFNGKLRGWLGFFDAAVAEPQPFSDETEFLSIRPTGGGGTRFDIIFDYVREEMQEHPPVSIIIMTDGYAPFPEESEAMGIPVLWLLNNTEIDPPWGRVTRITVEE